MAECEKTSKVLEVCWENVMNRSELSAGVFLHEVLERWIVRLDDVVQFELLDLIPGQREDVLRQVLHDKTLDHPKGVW